jgi:tetratricopeptide (TPR) repeat protein
VEQAHRLAVSFNAKGDRLAAREALSQIVARNLPGEPDDFHNAHTEAMRMEEVQLALDIVEAGLKFFPDHYELVPDKVRVLQSVGRAEEARATIEQWIKDKPHEFTRSWRGAVFYANLFDALEMTEEAAERVERALRLAVERLPREVKPATALARFYQRLGKEEEAIKVFEDALKKNPFSQQLNYNLGEMYLRGGDVSRALAYLQQALWLDYQEQYQHDVDQHAVRATLAQAYEAAGELEKAELLYRSVVDEGRAERTIVTYCRNRLAAIALRQGKLPRPDDGADPAAQVAQLLREAIGERANVAQTGE